MEFYYILYTRLRVPNSRYVHSQAIFICSFGREHALNEQENRDECENLLSKYKWFYVEGYDSVVDRGSIFALQPCRKLFGLL